ncbi:MAG TPA: ABC transporter substrate-binding protein, partial [Acidimicrobiales bacterium]
MRTRRAIVRLLVAAFVWALVASGCSSGGDEPSTGGDVTTTSLAPRATSEPEDAGPRAGGTLTMATFLAATALDPVVAPGGGAASGTEMAAIYDTLVRWNPTTGTYEPRTALAVEPSPDFTQWTIRLRPDVRFSDGTPYDAAAVKNGLDRHRAPANLTMSAAHMSRVADVALVDPLTVQVTLREPWPGFIAVLADEPGMIPSPTA